METTGRFTDTTRELMRDIDDYFAELGDYYTVAVFMIAATINPTIARTWFADTSQEG